MADTITEINEMAFNNLLRQKSEYADRVIRLEDANIHLKARIKELEAENKKMREALHRIRHHVVGFKSNGEILSEIDEALGEVEK